MHLRKLGTLLNASAMLLIGDPCYLGHPTIPGNLLARLPARGNQDVYLILTSQHSPIAITIGTQGKTPETIPISRPITQIGVDSGLLIITSCEIDAHQPHLKRVPPGSTPLFSHTRTTLLCSVPHDGLYPIFQRDLSLTIYMV